MSLEIDDNDKKLLSHFLQLSVQRKIQGFKFRQELNKNTNTDDNYNGRFSNIEVKNLYHDYFKAVNIIKELFNDRFDQDFNVRVNLIKNLEKILKIDPIFTCLITLKISYLINDNNINVIKAIIDMLYNQIEIIISDLLLPYSIKQLLIEKENYKKIEELQENIFNKDSWWNSEICRELSLGTNESLDSFYSIIKLISKILETHGNGGTISNRQKDRDLIILNSYQIDDEWKKEILYKKALKLAFKILRICMINTNILQEVKSNLIIESRNRVNHQYWDYPGNFDLNKKSPRVITMHNSQNNSNYVYFNQFGCILPIEVVLCKKSILVFENIVRSISDSIECSGKFLLRLKNNNYLNVCYWIQFIGWLCSSKGIYLSRFISSIIEFSKDIFSQNNEKEIEKINAIKFVFQEELLRILASAHTYDNIILFGEIISILNKLGKKGNLYELRQEAINKFNKDNKDDNKNTNNNSMHVDEKNESSNDTFPPIQAQKLRGRSTRYSYKRMKYDVDDGFYKISPQSVIEGVTWLFLTNSYSNVIDIAINNFLNLKIPSNLFLEEGNNEECNRQRKNVDLMLNSSKFPWTNEFSPLDSNKKLEFNFQDEKQNIEEDYEKEIRKLDDEMFVFKYQNKEMKQVLDTGSDIDPNIIEEDFNSKKRTLSSLVKVDNAITEEKYEIEGLTNAINTGTWKELKNNSNSIKSILFSQIITSVLVSPVVDISTDGLCKVSRTMLNNNQLMNVLKYGQLILTSWELLLKRINESEDKDNVTSNIENYGEGVNIAWNLLVERITNAFEILFYKYRLLIRLILNKERTLLDNKSDLKMEQVFIEILVKTLLSETKELLTNILLITNINDEEYSNEINEDYLVYLDNILYHNKLNSHNIQFMNENSMNNNEALNTSNKLRNINIVFILWIYNFVLEQRIKVLHNLFFRFYHLDSNVNQTELIFEKVFQWIISENDMNNDVINEENENQIFFDYSKLFIFCFNNFTKCISDYDTKSNIFLSQLKNLIMNTPKIPLNFLRLLFNQWIFSNNYCMQLSTLSNEHPAQMNSDNALLLKREYALNIFYELLNSSYPIDDIRKISYFVLVVSFLSYNSNASNSNFLDNICLFFENEEPVHTESSFDSCEGNGKLDHDINFFEFTKELFSIENIQNNKRINIQLKQVNNQRYTFVENLISVLYCNINKVNMDSHNDELTNLKTCLNEEMNNWNNIKIYGEKWMIILSFILVSTIISDEINSDYNDEIITDLFKTNKFISLIAKNVLEMIKHELRPKYKKKYDLNIHIYNYFRGVVDDLDDEKDKEDFEDEFNRSNVNERIQNMVIDQNQSNDTIMETINLENIEVTYIGYVEDLFSRSALLFKYYSIRYPCLINCLFKLYSRVIDEIHKNQQDKSNNNSNLKMLKLLNKVKDLYNNLFKEIVLLFKQHYKSENGNLGVLIKEYLRILDIYSSDHIKYSYLFDFIVHILENINFSNLELCLKVYNIFKDTQNINIIIPMIGYYDLQKIKELLPLIINKSDKPMIKECIKNIVTNPFALKDKVISSSDLLLLLISYSYPDVNYVDKKKTVDIIDCCFELTQSNPPVFDSEIIASVIGKIVQDEKSVFPRTLGRTLVLSVMYLPTVRSFISSFVISSLIRNYKVWEDTLTWRGVKHCIQKLWCDYKASIFPSLILLPQIEFQGIFNELIETNSDLRVDCMDIIKKTVSLIKYNII
ncbi:symplekin tight junction carboxy-terminal [Cryptosporidium sp. chipmunk genotype I]|uniref:symplekin tight junction carboxy-terminal n=1 Tax=Cryptosporidium sp. chipmunk genotype I TaxID=1280935 RepID=UPI00351A338F|nr:symplekin tight junction carboxy-terminal [Cryptosporidium sp. chipmunk genotype I]